MILRQSLIRNAGRLALCAAAAGLLLAGGCDVLIDKVIEKANDVPNAPMDPFVAATADAEAGERPFIEAARPFLTAIAGRNYAGAFHQLSSHARARIRPDQFVPLEDAQAPQAAAALENLTQDQFVEWMQKMEQKLGVPRVIDHLSVFSTDPQVLAGRGDRMDVMFAIGGMPGEIPAEIRKASIRAAIVCQPEEETVKQIAVDLQISEDQVRAGNLPENDKGHDTSEWPYLNVKFVLVEEAGQLKVGYFEFMPPSMWD